MNKCAVKPSFAAFLANPVMDSEIPAFQFQNGVHISGFSHDGELSEFKVKTQYSDSIRAFKIPIFTIAEPEDGSYIPPKDRLILLGRTQVNTTQYRNSFMFEGDFRKRALAENATFHEDKKAVEEGNAPFQYWLYQEDTGTLTRAELTDTLSNNVYSMAMRLESAWRAAWHARLARVSDLYKTPSSRWSVSARFFKPEKLDYGIVLQPGTWGEGGRLVEVGLMEDLVKQFIPAAYAEHVTVAEHVDWNEYVEISRHPFGFYTTYIHRLSLRRWEAELCRYGKGQVDGIWRRQPTEDDRKSLADVEVRLVNSWDDWLKFALENTSQRIFVRVLQGVNYSDEALAMMDCISPEMLNIIKQCRALSTEQRFKIENFFLFGQKLAGAPKDLKGMTDVVSALKTTNRSVIKELLLRDPVEVSTITVGTTQKLLGTVREKRKKSQKTVMFDVSASEIAKVLWKPLAEPGHKVPIVAEWLHRSAFSFGGLGFPGDWEVLDAQSSQHGKNLVFGTSEANTHMLRYESAIKDAIVLTRQVYPDSEFDVNTSLMSLDGNEPYSAWYSPYMDYYYSIERKEQKASATGLVYSLGRFGGDKRFDLFSRYRPFLFESQIDGALMKALGKRIATEAGVAEPKKRQRSSDDVDDWDSE
ncbi:hypothetical protein OBBRIDRAFT_155690 [Obba rivulosa]|uniref:Uncharacterized protein n=1 Tax=Obba rivulosa TaxID=1052685 RepID=A0A8E2ASQ5_9APHY|nr:hypothetical protein OBBRIDRAFT_155690 [Obba rivulosa]